VVGKTCNGKTYPATSEACPLGGGWSGNFGDFRQGLGGKVYLKTSRKSQIYIDIYLG